MRMDRTPLAERMRPKTLDEVVGQEHLLAPGKLLRRAIEADRLTSLILYGPPGCGKTSLAEVIATVTHRYFERTSGVLANVSILRALLEGAVQRSKLHRIDTILFIDEIHRFNKAQQDVLLPYVESGAITLIGATTHNPFFFINAPLVSRSQIVQLETLSEDAILTLLERARVLCAGELDKAIEIEADACRHLARMCEGDARKALNALEIALLTTPPDADGVVRIDQAATEESIQKKAVLYDKDEDSHHDTISAFIKSVRGSDPNAALYWLAKMLVAGEDPRFIARRLIILASEDIGNADPSALGLAVSAMRAVDFVGMPEARITLGQATTYLACAPKSNAAYMGLEKAMADIREGRTLAVPKHLRSASYKGAGTLGHEGYQYAHDFEGHVVDQEYMPTSTVYYEPTSEGYEARIQQRIEQWNQLRQKQRRQRKEASP
ncbi:MAG: replication-associated recombination protein A [Verrucomicrobia bacterium]|nr:replication-associated recombination protein A [Kiritimatiellia bacterium]MCP5489315.1 replication-associated recombination protein A [Verrucomicrobiota bacterium]